MLSYVKVDFKRRESQRLRRNATITRMNLSDII